MNAKHLIIIVCMGAVTSLQTNTYLYRFFNNTDYNFPSISVGRPHTSSLGPISLPARAQDVRVGDDTKWCEGETGGGTPLWINTV